MCDYTGSHFGAYYEDACCIDGFLWDLDSGDEYGLAVGGDTPCPKCNTNAYLDDALDNAYGTVTHGQYSAAEILRDSVRLSVSVNKGGACKWIISHRFVRLYDWPDDSDYLYNSEPVERDIDLLPLMDCVPGIVSGFEKGSET